jgi:protocatechuate 3,4-dioxygenase beta subunit
MDRRTFIGTGASLASLSAPKWLFGQGCPATETDRYGQGPFYLEDGPARARLSRPGEPGEALSVAGTVSNCRQALPGVKIEVWQATHSGCYIHPSLACDGVPGNDAEARLWGVLTSDAEGKYAFDSIKPGRYLNGARYRPSHIHFRITVPGRNVFAGSLDNFFTQLYFEGDEYIQGDYAADHPSAASRIIPLARQGSGPWTGTFDINLPAVPDGTGVRDPFADPALGGFDAAVRLRRTVHRLLPIELDATFLPSGVYQAEFRWWTARGLRREPLRFVL